MKIGSLYTVKKCFWLLFPTKEIAAATARDAADWSRNYLSPDSIIVFLEEDGDLKKFLTSEGKIGWTVVNASYNNYFEEMKA